MKSGNYMLKNYTLWMLIGGLTLCFTSCDDRENVSGREAEIQFLINGRVAWGSETTMRNASDKARTVETQIVPMDNNWTLEVNLVEDPAPPTRAGDDLLIDGAKVRVIVHSGSTIAGEADYTYSSGKLVLDGTGVTLTDGDYAFKAYSYNLQTLPTSTSTSTIAVSPYVDGTVTNDLLWGSSPLVVPISGSGDNSVALSLDHKFSRMRYSVTTPPNVTTDIAVSLINNYSANLAKVAGTLAKDISIPQPLVKVDVGTTGTTDDDAFRIVYTSEEKPIIKITGSVTGPLGDVVTFTNDRYVTFNKELEAGGTYTLQINFKQGLTWAGSNIYWVEDDDPDTPDIEGYLTFAAPGTTDKQFYQGVFFRWGSLVGISPVASTSGDVNFSPTVDPIYVPIDDNDPSSIKWVRTTVTNAWQAYGWTDAPNSTPSTPYAFDSIPHVYNVSVNDPTTNYLASSGVHDPAHYKGDICKYLSGQPHTPMGVWVMPTFNDFFLNIKQSDKTDWNVTPTSSPYWRRVPQSGGFTHDYYGVETFGYPFGTYENWDWGMSYSGVTIFPASGARLPHNGNLSSSNYGDYWCSSAMRINAVYWYDTATDTNFLAFDGYGLYPSNPSLPGYGQSVRCLLQE